MLKNRIVSGLLIAAMALGITACGTAGSPDGRPGEIVKDQAYGKEGDGNDASEAGGADNSTDTTSADDSANNGGAGADDPATATDPNNNDTQTKPTLGGVTGGLVIDNQTEDYVVFSYEYSNMAWGFQSYKELFLNDGSVYYFRNAPGTAGDKKGRELAVTYLRKYAEPTYYLKVDDLRELYESCKKVDPNVETGRKNSGNDMGSYSFTFYDPETSNEIKIFCYGDWTMTTDDQALLDAQKTLLKVLGEFSGNIKDMYLSLSSPVLNIPYGGRDLIGRNMSFDSYDKLKEFCEKNGIDLTKYMTENDEKNFKQAKYIALQVFDTNLMIDGYMTRGNEEFRFLPSLADYEKNPDFEGKVTVAIMRCDTLEKYDYVNEKGNPWK
jgi:hypothetical protein